jgi:uncharacterized protein (TIGR03083 family)
MNLWDVPAEDVRPLLRRERQDLVGFITALSPEEWLRPTAAPGWSVKDLALHLLDDDLGWLSRGRDRDRSGVLDMSDATTFVEALAAKNQAWIDGARQLSQRVVGDLLRWCGDQMDAYYDSMVLSGDGWVSWASEAAVPVWFDIAQDLTERWVHQRQMREAVGAVGSFDAEYLPAILRTFVWAVPHQYRVAAEAGAVVSLDLACGGVWSITSDGAGGWSLREGETAKPAARLTVSDDAGWRWFTGGAVPSDGIVREGPAELLNPLLRVRGIIA